MPKGYVRDAILGHIRETHTPETLRGVVFTPPPLDIRHEKIGDFTVDPRKRRGRGDVPCSLCSRGQPKFLTGSLLWSEDGHIRTIGNCCAKGFFAGLSGGYLLIERRHEQRERQRDAEDTLMRIVPRMGAMFDYVHAVNESAFDAGRAAKEFRRGVPALAKTLADAARRGGHLDIVRRTAEASAPEGVGVLRGGRFCLPTYQPQAKPTPILLDIARFDLNGQPPRGEPEAFTYITGLDDQQMIDMAKRATKVVAAVKRLAQDIEGAWEFMEDANLKALQTWGQHPDAGLKFEVEYSWRSVLFETRHGDRVGLDRRPFRQPLPKLPAEIAAL